MTSPSLLRERPRQPWLAVAMLTLAGVLIGLSCVALGLLFLSGGYWDPDDYTSAYYRAEIARHRGILQAVLLIPLAALALAILAGLTSFVSRARIRGALWAGSLSVCVGLLMVCAGMANIAAATRFSQMGW